MVLADLEGHAGIHAAQDTDQALANPITLGDLPGDGFR
jgi:hypothetical protein